MPVLGLIELIFFGTALDRRYYNESPKWWILFGGISAAAVWFWGETDFSSIWSAVTSWSFWKPFGIYLIAGLAYSVSLLFGDFLSKLGGRFVRFTFADVFKV